MNINLYRKEYKGSSVRLEDLIEEYKEDEDFISLVTWDQYFEGEEPTLKNLLSLIGNVKCKYLGEKYPYYCDDDYLDFVCWPDEVPEGQRKPKTNGIHFAFGVRSE